MTESFSSSEPEPAAEGESQRVRSDEEDWTKQRSKLNKREDKVKALQLEIYEKIKLKKKAKSRAEKQRLISEIVLMHEEMKQNMLEFNEIRKRVKYRFPDKGEYTERRYLPMRIQELEELEKGVGIEAQMTRIKKKVEDKYAPLMTKEAVIEQKAKALRAKQKDKEPTERLRLEQ